MKNLDLFLYLIITFASIGLYAAIGMYFGLVFRYRKEILEEWRQKAEEKLKRSLKVFSINFGAAVFVLISMIYVACMQLSTGVKQYETKRGTTQSKSRR